MSKSIKKYLFRILGRKNQCEVAVVSSKVVDQIIYDNFVIKSLFLQKRNKIFLLRSFITNIFKTNNLLRKIGTCS